MIPEGVKLAKLCRHYAEDKKCVEPVILNLQKLEGPAPFFFICSGLVDPHLKAIANEIVVRMKEEHNIKPDAREGNVGSNWIVLDYGDVLVHILNQEKRLYYNLEGLWGDAEKVE
ncbi:MAG: ribosome silencing factor [Verrucomicrobiota bacterium]